MLIYALVLKISTLFRTLNNNNKYIYNKSCRPETLPTGWVIHLLNKQYQLSVYINNITQFASKQYGPRLRLRPIWMSLF
jgi:hypothetical protein